MIFLFLKSLTTAVQTNQRHSYHPGEKEHKSCVRDNSLPFPYSTHDERSASAVPSASTGHPPAPRAVVTLSSPVPWVSTFALLGSAWLSLASRYFVVIDGGWKF